MNWNSNIEERRKYPRHYPDKDNQPKVNFIFSNNSKISINAMNFSKGGLMGYTSSIEHFLGIEDQHIKLIEVIFPNKDSFRCSGRILRLQPIINENRCYCAVEFSNNETEDMDEIIDDTIDDEQLNTDNLEKYDEEFIHRIQQAENYSKIGDSDKEAELRRAAYDKFNDITQQLTVEERWWFYEILDDMKRYEPNYPKELKQAFLKMCRTAMRRSMNNRSAPEIQCIDL